MLPLGIKIATTFEFHSALQVLLLHERCQEGDHAAIAQTPPELLHCRLPGVTCCILITTETLIVPMNADAQTDEVHCHVQKAGTTSLADHLRRHPALGCVDGPRLHPVLRKESHFHDGVLGRQHASAAWLYRYCHLPLQELLVVMTRVDSEDGRQLHACKQELFWNSAGAVVC